MRVRRRDGGQELLLDASQELGAGGEARIFAVSGEPGVAAKIYRKPTAERESKLTAMAAAPPEDKLAEKGHVSIAWPQDLLYGGRDGTTFVGFLMPRVSNTRPIISYYNPMARRRACPLFSYRYLHRTARNLAAAVHALHASGYVIGDVNETNILATDSALVTLVDTDSFQVRDLESGTLFRCPVGRPEYTPAELQGEAFREVDRLPQHDRFALGVLVFQLLLEGTHPYAGVYTGSDEPPDYGRRIQQAHFVYGERETPYRPLPAAPDYAIVAPGLRALFDRCFVAGHHDPPSRPEACEWVSALEDAERAFIVCSANPQHWYGDHLAACPWCARARRLGGRDPFPSRDAVARGEHLGQPRSASSVEVEQQPLPAVETPAPVATSAPAAAAVVESPPAPPAAASPAPTARVIATRAATSPPPQLPHRTAWIAAIALLAVVGGGVWGLWLVPAQRAAQAQAAERSRQARLRREALTEGQAAARLVQGVQDAISRYKRRTLTDAEAARVREQLQARCNEALSHCEAALSADPRNHSALVARVDALRLEANNADAREALRSALAIYPTDPELLQLDRTIPSASR